MKRRSSSLKRLVLISLAVVLVLALAAPALAATIKKTIDVYTGVSIYMDDELLEPKDANGNPVEVFIYNGTTYLPVRAISEAVGKPVQWEGKTSSVYLGKHSSEKPALMLKDLDYYSRDGSFAYESSNKDNLGKMHTDIYYPKRWQVADWQTYRIDGQYSAISGCFFQCYPDRDDGGESVLKIYGDGILLFSASVRGGTEPIDPIDFKVDITGVLELKIEMQADYWSAGRLGEAGLWT